MQLSHLRAAFIRCFPNGPRSATHLARNQSATIFTTGATALRYDDRLKTALSGQQTGQAAVQWRQLIDLLAQSPAGQDQTDVAIGLARLRHLHEGTSEAVRAQSVRALSGRLRSAPLVRFLCSDKPAVAAEAVRSARLTDEEWAAMVPGLPTRARGFLRQRDDIGPATARALSAWTHADFVLQDDRAERRTVDQSEAKEPAVEPTVLRAAQEATSEAGSSAESPSQISALVDRIRRFQEQRERSEAPQLPLEGGSAPEPAPSAERFTFETDARGLIREAEGVPIGAVAGVSIAQEAYEDDPGPDAFAAAAFRQRMPIAGARMRLTGAPMVAGDWRIHAGPMFDDRDGRFLGFKGMMRRPHAADDATITVRGTEDSGSDQMRQLVHELRTPLNAIIGFAEIIEQQLFGPVSSAYRALATSILDDARRLLSGFDDLDLAARLETGRLDEDEGTTEAGWLLNRMADRLRTLTDMRGVSLHLRKAETVRAFALGQQSAERIATRLVSALVIGCERGERIDCVIRTRIGMEPVNLIDISRPKRLAGKTEEELLSTESGADEAGEPLLGLGFSLRLVRNLAQAAGGDLRFEEDSLLLRLPAVKERLGREGAGRLD